MAFTQLLATIEDRGNELTNYYVEPFWNPTFQIDDEADKGQSNAIDDDSENFGDKKKFPPYQPATFRSWRMNLPTPLRYANLGDPLQSRSILCGESIWRSK